MKLNWLVFIFLYFSSPALAITWFVEEDGSTGFSTIQSAVDAAASGDTIRIGPGVFDNVHALPDPYSMDYATLFVPIEELTIIGAGPDETFIGQDFPYEANQGPLKVIVAGDTFGNERFIIEDVCIQNSYQGILFEGGGELEISNCHFQSNQRGVFLYPGEINSRDFVTIEGCLFNNVPEDFGSPEHIWCSQQNSLVVRNTEFEITGIGASIQAGCSGRQAIFENCNFHGGRVGIASVANELIIRDCLLEEQQWWGVMVSTGVVEISDSTIRDQQAALYCNNYSHQVSWAVERVLFENVSDSTFRYRTLGPGYIRDCILAKGEQFVVRSYYLENPDKDITHFDMTDNWWGTTDPDSIQAWIYDATDNETLGTIIDWDPFKAEAVPVEKQSLSNFKAMFRDATR